MVIRVRVNHIFMFNCFILECDGGAQTFSLHYDQEIHFSLATLSREKRVDIYWLKWILLHHIILSIWNLWWTFLFVFKALYTANICGAPPCTCSAWGSWYHLESRLRRSFDLWPVNRLGLLLHWPVIGGSSPWGGGIVLSKTASSSLEAESVL